MLIKTFFTFILLFLFPASFLLIFKPQIWQNLYTAFYFNKIESQGNSFIKSIAKSFLNLVSTDLGRLLHQIAGVILGIFSLYLLIKKSQIFP